MYINNSKTLPLETNPTKDLKSKQPNQLVASNLCHKLIASLKIIFSSVINNSEKLSVTTTTSTYLELATNRKPKTVKTS